MNDDAPQLISVNASRPSDAAHYRYDAAGNPVDRAELGFAVTNSFNNLNQIVSGVWTGSTLTVAGTINHPAGSIAVNGVGGTIYPDGSFSVSNVPVALGTNTLTATYTGPAYTNAPMTATDTVSVVLANAAYTHDANGNLTGDATFTYQYDTANQLTNVIRKADNARVLSCRYDALGRRVEAIRADGTVDRYVYFPGSFLVLAVLDENNACKEFYTRGPDLSGSLDGAGGIGGILACSYTLGSKYYFHADIMGNVLVLTDATSAPVSSFRYTPFGQLTSLPSDAVFPRYLFETKEVDLDASILFFGCRVYLPRLGQWLTRDPLGEQTPMSLYRFSRGAPLDFVDAWGLKDIQPHRHKSKAGVQPVYQIMEQPDKYTDQLPDFPKEGIWMCQEELIGPRVWGILHHRFLVVDGEAKGFEKKNFLGLFNGEGRIRDEQEEDLHQDVRCYEMKCLKKDCATKVFHSSIALAEGERYWLGYQDCQSWANNTENWMYDDCADCEHCSREEIKMARRTTWKRTGFSKIKARGKPTPESTSRELPLPASPNPWLQPVVW